MNNRQHLGRGTGRMEKSLADNDPLQTNADHRASALALVNTSDEAALLADVSARLDHGRGFAIATLNLDHIVKLRRDPTFARAYDAQSNVVADGNPVVWLCHLAGRRDVRLVPGSELIAPLAALAAQKDVALAFLGSTEPVLRAAKTRLEADHPGLTVVACLAPPFGFDPKGAEADALLDRVAASGARICLLALGAPKQEILAARGYARHPGIGFLSIGAGLDFIAGHQTRAPLWVRRVAMEWLWRMLTNPGRLARRYLDCALILPGLTVAALSQRQGKRSEPPRN